MLARLQQTITLGLLACALLLSVWGWHSGHFGWAMAAVVLLVGGYALALALEFLMLALLNRPDPAPRPSTSQLFKAWAGEVIAAPQTFCWRQPFFSQRWPDHLPAPAQGRRGLLLVHGFFCNRGLWNSWLERLHAQGVPFVAINLEPVFGSIDDYTGIIESAVCRLEQATGMAPVIVAHSMGGLAVRRWWLEQANAARVHHIVTLGAPHQGTWLARFAMTKNSRQMRQLNGWLNTMVARESATSMRHFTCFYSHCDNIVFPAAMATLPGADNRHLAGVAHVHMVSRPEPFEAVMRSLSGNLSPR